MKWWICFLFLFVSLDAGWSVGTLEPVIGLSNIELVQGYNMMAVTFKREPIYSGVIDNITGSILTIENLNEFDSETTESAVRYRENELVETRHYVWVHDSIEGNKGRFYDIVHNTDTTVTIDSNYGVPDIFDSIHIIPYTTLDYIFEEYEDSIDRDRIHIWTHFGWKSYAFRNTQWYTAGTRADQGNTIIRPDQGIVYSRHSPDSMDLVIADEVYAYAQIRLPAQNEKHFGNNPYPTNIEMNKLFEEVSGHFTNDDLLYLWQGTSWEIYQFNTTVNGFVNILTNELNRELEPHQPYFIIKASNTTIYFIKSEL